jgi:hypothetical protein
MTKRKIEYWVIPPDADGEFVANMEEVLETYEKAYDPACPVVCMDEQPVQLIGETRVPIAATKEHPERVDYEYERKGTASIFMFAEPLSGFRQATARPRRTKDDWAHEVADLLDTRYPGVERITLVCDNLNTHTKGALGLTGLPQRLMRRFSWNSWRGRGADGGGQPVPIVASCRNVPIRPRRRPHAHSTSLPRRPASSAFRLAPCGL